MGRSRQAPKLAYALSERFDVQWIESRYSSSRGTWTLEWGDGPTTETVRAAVAELAPALSPAIPANQWTYERTVQPLGFAVQLIRLIRAGETDDDAPRSDLRWSAENAADHTDYPDRAASGRDQEMARRLVAEGDGSERDMAELVAKRGIVWLLGDGTAPGASGSGDEADGRTLAADPADAATALETLTRQYATGTEVTRWQRRMQTLPVREAVQRAAADPATPESAIAAALLLFPELRADLDRMELALLERARADGGGIKTPMSWDRIGRALGVSYQAAQQRLTRLRAGASRRLVARKP